MKLIDQATGKTYDVPDAEVETAQQKYGLITEQEAGAQSQFEGLGSQLRTAGEEAIRTGAALIPGVDAGAAPKGLTELEPGQQENALTGVYSPEARERRERNPVSAGFGNAAPAVIGGLVLPGVGWAGAAATLGLDAATGYAQEAVDAELENRDIRGEDVLRNAGLNAAFSLGFMGLGAAGKAALKGGKNLLETAAEAARAAALKRAGGAEGEELAKAAAEPAARDELLGSLRTKIDEAVNTTAERLEQARAPKAANNPNAQREALETLNDSFAKSDPSMVEQLRAFESGPPGKRLEGLRAARAALSDDSELGKALDSLISREDLWGQEALGHGAKLDAALKLRPPPGASPEELLQFADAVRQVDSGAHAGLADRIEQLAERHHEINAASVLGDAPEAAAAKGIDYHQAIKTLDPTEAWRLTKDGADEGLRKVEANTVSDALQRVDDTLKEDVAMSVKRQDFVKGAESWSPAQIEKQTTWVQEVWHDLGSLLEDVGKSKGANPESGYALGGFAANAERLLNMHLPRIAAADPIARNFEIDQLKRGLDAIVRDLPKSKTLDEASKAFGVKRILEVTDKLRYGLEDASLFGRNAALQSETNAAWKKLIDPYKRVKNRLSEFLGREFGNTGAESGNMIRFNPDQVERAMAGYDRNFRKDLADAIKGIDQMMGARQTNGLSHLDQLAAARADLQRIKDGFEFSDLLRNAKAKAKEPASAAIFGRAINGGVSGAVAGAALGGIPGAVAGAAAGVAAQRGLGAGLERVALLKPGSKTGLTQAVSKHLGLMRAEQGTKLLADEAFAGTLPDSLKKATLAAGASSEPAAAKALALADEAAKSASRDRQLTARLMVDPNAARKYLRLAGDIATPLQRFQGENDTPQQAFAGYRQMLDGFSRDPENMLNMLSEEFGDVSSMSPKLQREMVIQATKVVNYLQENMPGKRNVSVVYPNGTPPSSMEVRQFALRFTAATDPASVLSDAKAGRLQKVQLDTLQALWPREYDALKAEALQALGNEKASTLSRQRMSLLFNFGSGVDPALGPKTRAIVATARAAQQAQAPAPSTSQPSASTRKAVSANNTPAGMASLTLGQQLTF